MTELAASYGLTQLGSRLMPLRAYVRMSGTITEPVLVDVSYLQIDLTADSSGCTAQVDATVSTGWAEVADCSYKEFVESVIVGGALRLLRSDEVDEGAAGHT